MDKPSKIRDDLIIRENVKGDGTKVYVIKDPLTEAYFQVGEPEYFIISILDGTKSVSEIAADFKQRFQVDIELETIDGFLNHLQNLCFLDNDLTRQELLTKQRIASVETKKTTFQKAVFIKIKAIDPGRLFDRLINYCRFFFTRKFVWSAGFLISFAFLLTLSNNIAITSDFSRLLNLQGIIIFYVSMFVVLVLHEFAHGLACKHYGGEVHEIGFLLIYFQPAFYCNVSDAWLFTEKSKRLTVSLAGGFFQLFLWAVAVIIWRVTSQDTLINEIALAVIYFAGIATLFNFNPLLKYDGYYLLSDWLEIPNLRRKAGSYWRGLMRKIFLGDQTVNSHLTSREKRIFFYYGFLSFIYVVFVLGYFFLLLAKFLVSRLGGTGFVIFAAIMAFLFRNIIMDAVEGAGEMIKARRSAFRKGRTWILIGLLTVILFFVIFFVRVPLRVKGDLVINPLQSLLLKYNSAGYAEVVLYDIESRNPGQQRQVNVFSGYYTTTRVLPQVKLNDTVKAGEVIARLVNSETLRLIDDYRARLKQAEAELTLLKEGPRPQEIDQARNTMNEYEAQLKSATLTLQRINDMLTKNLVSKQEWEKAHTDSAVWDSKFKAARSYLWMLKAGNRPEQIKAKEAEVAGLKSQLDFQSREQQSFEIKSEINGVVLQVDTGETVCEVTNLDTMEARIYLSEKELSDIAPGQKVKFKVRGYPAFNFYGEVTRIDSKVGVDGRGNRVIEVSSRVPNDNRILIPGMTGVANIYCGSRPFSYHIYRKFFRTIRTEFWDWFDWL
ncbi:conserved membrane hypothetical protein [Candidatus Zixiibacteriota bacterium]|nr:conserved membrane hypothetical protein [candidate division Zixibacteria bacterium]